jgi:nucleotide-binding universal stress UspA family protein
VFQRIFVLREGATRAEQGSLLAERIARVSGGTVMLPSEVSVSPASGSHQQPARSPQERANGTSAKRSCSLPSAAPSQAAPGTEASVGEVSGKETLGLFEMAHAPESDLLLITGPGCVGSEPWMLEHVAQRAAPYSPVPVLILREGETALSSTPLNMARPLHPPTAAVALDGSRQAEAAILPAAHLTAQLSAPAKGSLHLTRIVLRPDVDAFLHDQEHIDPHQRDQMMHEAMDYLCQITNDLRASLEGELGLTITWSIALDSDVVNALVDIAERSHVIGGTCLFGGCDLLALATHSRDAKGYWIPGNVTGRLFTSTNLPLLLV